MKSLPPKRQPESAPKWSCNVMLPEGKTNPPQASRTVYDGLCGRCAELGITLWHCDAAGNVQIEPLETATPAKSDIQRVAKVMCHMSQLQPMELAPGCWAVAVDEKQGNRRTAI